MPLSKQFIEDAMRTNSDKTGTFDIKPDTIHAVLGINSEVFEFLFASDPHNAFEEYSDLMWFAALFTHSTGIAIEIAVKDGDENLDIVAEACNILDMLKACYAYGGKKGKSVKDMQYQMAVSIELIIRRATIHLLEAFPERTPETLIEPAQALVIAKLKARYPDKFTVEHAQNRDLGYESEVISKSIN